MRAIIPVAGIGSRLRPHTYTLPKVLLSVGGKPIIGHILDKIVEHGITSATIVVGYLGEMIQEYIQKNYSIDINFIYQEERRGLAHSIYLTKDFFTNDPLIIILGDTIFDVDLKSFINSDFTSLGVKTVENPKRFGVAELEGKYISKLVEKPENPASNLALVGLYFIKNPHLLEESISYVIQNGIKTKNEYQLTDALQIMINKGEKMIPFQVEGWYDCGKAETLLATNKHLLDKKSSIRTFTDAVIIPPVYISKTCKINKSVIGPYASISDGVEISESIVRNSIIGSDSRVEKTLLEDSIIGNNAIVQGSYNRVNAGDSTEIEFF